MRFCEPVDVRLQQLVLEPRASSTTLTQQLLLVLQQQTSSCQTQQMLQQTWHYHTATNATAAAVAWISAMQTSSGTCRGCGSRDLPLLFPSAPNAPALHAAVQHAQQLPRPAMSPPVLGPHQQARQQLPCLLLVPLLVLLLVPLLLLHLLHLQHLCLLGFRGVAVLPVQLSFLLLLYAAVCLLQHQ